MGSIKKAIQADIEKLQKRLAVIDRIPEDKYSIGTAVVFAFNTGAKRYYVKTEEEGWATVASGSKYVNTLEYWILKSIDESQYFEIYEMRTQPQPIYASE